MMNGRKTLYSGVGGAVGERTGVGVSEFVGDGPGVFVGVDVSVGVELGV